MAAVALCGCTKQFDKAPICYVNRPLRATAAAKYQQIMNFRVSARASYLTIAWGNRLGTPPAREKQAVLDEKSVS
jgi:hypothetical protein